jgi:hypothetical protein
MDIQTRICLFCNKELANPCPIESIASDCFNFKNMCMLCGKENGCQTVAETDLCQSNPSNKTYRFSERVRTLWLAFIAEPDNQGLDKETVIAFFLAKHEPLSREHLDSIL